MDDLVKKYLTEKYGEDYDTKAKEDYESAQSRNKWANLGSDLGDVIAGNRVGSGDAYFQNLNKQAKERTLGAIDKSKQDYLSQTEGNQKLKDILTRDEIEKAQADPTSRQSVLANALAKKYNLPVQEGDSFRDINQFMDPKKMLESEALANVDFNKQKALKGMDQRFKEKEDALNRQNEIDKLYAKAKMESDKKKDVQNLSSTDKARFDNALMAIKGIDEMAKALDKGSNTFSLVGDNDYTSNERRATEAYGRMQSGGAINKDEEARFVATLPKATDSKDIQRKKLLTQRDEMISRLKTLGFSPEDVGVKPLDFSYGKAKSEGQEKDVSDYAKAHGISYEQAAMIKAQRTQNAMR